MAGGHSDGGRAMGTNEPDDGYVFLVTEISEPDGEISLDEDELTVDPETRRQMRANLEALSGGPQHYEESEPDLPWWEGAPESTMTIVVGSAPADVAAALGHDLAVMRSAMVLDIEQDPDEDQAGPLSVIGLPGATAVYEVNGWQASQDSVLEALSRLGRTVSLYWNVNLVARFAVAEHGRVVRDLDPVLDAGGGAGQPLPEEEGIDWGNDPIAAAAGLQARIAGIHLTRGQVFGTPLPTVMVPW